MRSDGTEFPVEVTISRTINGHGTFLTAILRDVSGRTADAHELDRAREQLKEREGRLEAIVQSAMDAIITIDSEQRILLFNSAAEKMFGLTSSQAMGTHLDRFIPQRFRDAHRRQVERFALTGESSRRMGVQTALVAQRADGTEFPMEASISQTTVGGQKLLTVVLRDITGRVEAERQINRASEELRALSVAMLEVRETERTRIARELHDELGQALTALKMDVELLTTTISPGRRDQLEQTAAMIGLLDATMATTRRISADLRPLVLDDLGLAAAAEWVLQSLAQRAGIDYGLAIDPACAALGEPFASALFRVMQESLTNVVRHAGATRVDVRLTRSGDEALLIIQDDGIGIEPGAPAKVGSFGLRGIQERVLLLGGKLSIAGKPNRGTTVSARIPLAAATGGSGKPR
ncbi:MAG: histidine kinase [Proteobacteria bacterium]|nr:MAG: histidine kinase [Pseudomonadota bacterium]